MPDDIAPTIILLGGSSGTGKTTLANALVQEMTLAHHLSTGFVREVVRAVLPESRARLLQGFTFDTWHVSRKKNTLPQTVIAGALAQSRILQPAIEACIRRSVREGSSMVIEGAHMLPGLFDPKSLGVSLFCILDVPDRNELIRRALGPTHGRRDLGPQQLGYITELQDSCVSLAKEHEIPVIVNTDLDNTVAYVKNLLTGHRSL